MLSFFFLKKKRHSSTKIKVKNSKMTVGAGKKCLSNMHGLGLKLIGERKWDG